MKTALGTAAIGRPLYINIRGKSTSELSFIAHGKVILNNAYEKGIRHFDTALIMELRNKP